MEAKPHSEDYFGDTRDFWWNRDFLELMGRRWVLQEVQSVLDVGCGIGHWGRCLGPFLNPEATVTGVDREPRWIEGAKRRLPKEFSDRFSYQVGDGEHLDFPDGKFDMVTCQTLLIHVKDPLAVLREMVRVLAPGGIIAVVEPNNVAVNLSALDLKESTEKHIRPIEFQMICERGKWNLGEGFNSAGPMVAGWLSQLKLLDIRAYLSDKASVHLPPYSTAAEKAEIEEARDFVKRNFWIWDREETLRYYLAGGGALEGFETYWDEAMKSGREFVDAYATQSVAMASGVLIYLVSGRKAGRGPAIAWYDSPLCCVADR